MVDFFHFLLGPGLAIFYIFLGCLALWGVWNVVLFLFFEKATKIPASPVRDTQGPDYGLFQFHERQLRARARVVQGVSRYSHAALRLSLVDTLQKVSATAVEDDLSELRNALKEIQKQLVVQRANDAKPDWKIHSVDNQFQFILSDHLGLPNIAAEIAIPTIPTEARHPKRRDVRSCDYAFEGLEVAGNA